jgi:5'-methylthioadenosine phosphorylase
MIGIIGGSGLYDIDGLKNVRETAVRTPFGSPSDRLVTGEFEGVRVAFLPRHGRGHVIPPHQVNYRANICALKMIGVSRVVSVSAVGSMKEEIRPGHMVVPHQYFDRSICRPRTFFEDGITAHVQFGTPVCLDLAATLSDCAGRAGAVVHEGGTYVAVDGPTFSTKAESMLFRSWGMDIVGMTALPEARLAREAEMCYATLALSTDYDCWHEVEAEVSAGSIFETIRANVAMSREIVRILIPAAAAGGGNRCSCSSALAGAISTDPKRIGAAARRRLAPIAGKYLGAPRKSARKPRKR